MERVPAPTCDQCDRPATILEQDLQRDGDEDGWVKWKVYGKARFGCFQHPPRKARTFSEDRKELGEASTAWIESLVQR